jgi:hypothetical protein
MLDEGKEIRRVWWSYEALAVSDLGHFISKKNYSDGSGLVEELKRRNFNWGPRISRCNEAHVEADTTLLITAPATTIVERVVSDICSLPGARRVHAITPEKRQMMPVKIKKLLKKAPAVRAEITRILGKGDGSVTILYESNVRVPYTASRQVFMGAPDYAKAWPNALKTDRVLAVIEGNTNTIEQVKYIGTVLSINKVRDPLKK